MNGEGKEAETKQLFKSWPASKDSFERSIYPKTG